MPAQRAAAVSEILQAAAAAALLKVHYFVIHPGPEFSNEISAEERLARMENVVASLNVVAARCRELGIMCVLENKLPHLLFGNTSDILWILDAISTSEIGACLDTGHATIAGDIFTLLHKLAGHLRIIHAHDNDGHSDIHRTPGDGVIDWEKLLRDLVQAQFHGAFILELSSEQDMEATLAKARRGRQFLRALARRIALHVSDESGNEDRGAGERAAAQGVESFVRLLERKSLCFSAHRHTRREREKFLAVASRQIGDRTDRPLLPQIVIGKRRDVAHVNPAADHGAAALEDAQRCGHERTDRREDDRGLQSLRRSFIRTARPLRTEPAREILRRHVTRAGEREDFAILVSRDLRDDVGRRAEAVNPKSLRVARFAQTSIADQTRA